MVMSQAGMFRPLSSRWNKVFPELIIARLGMQTADAVPPGMCARVKDVPSRTSQSMLGVWISSFPSAWMVPERWSSVRIKKIFGFPI